MKRADPAPTANHTSLGFTLIELLISIAIMLVVLFAVTSVYISSRQLSLTQTAVSTMNKDGQSAVELLSREFRQAQQVGCPAIGGSEYGKADVSRDSISAVAGVNAVQFTTGTAFAVKTAGDTDTPSSALAGTPVIEVRRARDGGSQLSAPMSNRNALNAPILLRTKSNITMPTVAEVSATNTDPLAVISDCQHAEMFTVFAVAANNPWSVTPNNPLRWRYGPDARVSNVTIAQYFLGTHLAGDARQNTALYKRTTTGDARFWTVPQPLIHDVATLAVTVDVDADGDGLAEATQPFPFPAASPVAASKIVAITLGLALKSPNKLGTDGDNIKRSFAPTITLRARAS